MNRPIGLNDGAKCRILAGPHKDKVLPIAHSWYDITRDNWFVNFKTGSYWPMIELNAQEVEIHE